MAVVNRETHRDKLVTVLDNAVAGSGNVASSVYGYVPDNLEGESPIVCVISARTDRGRIIGSRAKDYDSEFHFNILLLVAESDASAGYSSQDVEDTVDELEYEVAKAILNNFNNDVWKSIQFVEPGEDIIGIEIGRDGYKLEAKEVVTVKNG